MEDFGYCHECDHDLEYDNDQKEVTCPFCGTIYTVEVDLDWDDYLFWYLIKK